MCQQREALMREKETSEKVAARAFAQVSSLAVGWSTGCRAVHRL